MGDSLLLEWYRDLPEIPDPLSDMELSGEKIRKAIHRFRRRVKKRYTEGTLQRLFTQSSIETRRAAVMAIGLIGTITSNDVLAKMLNDPDEAVARLAADSLWELWFRGGTPAENEELRRVMRLPDMLQILAGLDDMVREAPHFAEVFNQRAIIHFRRGDYQRSIDDCTRVLELNPHHFGALSGMGQCYLRMNRPHAALRAFRSALTINPRMDQLRDTIRSLEQAIEES